MASILAIYVDDERIHSGTEEEAWTAAHLVATRESYLGIQDAARKRRPPTQAAGTWTGSIIRTNDTEHLMPVITSENISPSTPASTLVFTIVYIVSSEELFFSVIFHIKITGK